MYLLDSYIFKKILLNKNYKIKFDNNFLNDTMFNQKRIIRLFFKKY